MLKWTDKTDGIDDIMAEDVNKLAHSIIENENTYETKEAASAKLTEAKNYTDNISTELKTLMILPKDDNNPDGSIEYENYNMELNFYVRSRLNTEGHTGLSITAERAETSLMAWKDGANNEIHTTYATKTELSSYSQKPTIITDSTSTTYNLEFLGSTNKIIRLTAPALSVLNLTFNNGEYNADLLINLVFTSGETAPQIAYPNTGIINWIGTDCALSEGKSIFTPSANTRYDIVFSFDGSQLVGYVCGYTPATVSNG